MYNSGDGEDLPLWKKFRDISIKEYSELYKVSIVVTKTSLRKKVTHFQKKGIQNGGGFNFILLSVFRD